MIPFYGKVSKSRFQREATELWLFLKPVGHPRANMRELYSAFLLFLNLFTLSTPFSELKGSNHHIHFFPSRAGVSLDPGAAALVAVRGEVPKPADQHLALQVHWRVPAHELKGIELEPSKVAGRGVVRGIGGIPRTPRKEQESGLVFMDAHVHIPPKLKFKLFHLLL